MGQLGLLGGVAADRLAFLGHDLEDRRVAVDALAEPPTVETRLNAMSARAWLAARFPDPAAIARHFVAVSAAPAKAVEFGIAEDNVYPLWDWVGGRYSLWSAVGLPIAFAVGMAGFRELLAGARALPVLPPDTVAVAAAK